MRRIGNKVMRGLRYMPPGPITDRLLVQLGYYRSFGRFPNLRKPKTFTEKIQRRKLFDRNALLPVLQDKYRVRSYVAERVGRQYLVPLFYVTENPDDIDLNALPDDFVLKANHGCGWNLFFTDKSGLDVNAVRGTMKYWMSSNFYNRTREWAYRDIPPLVMAEEFLHDNGEFPYPSDFKIACFDGEPRYLVVFKGRTTSGFQAGRFRIAGNELIPADVTAVVGRNRHIPLTESMLEFPKGVVEEMLEIASCLSERMDHLRVDLYLIGEKIFFGEMTLYYGSGFMCFEPKDFDLEMGSWWKQPY